MREIWKEQITCLGLLGKAVAEVCQHMAKTQAARLAGRQRERPGQILSSETPATASVRDSRDSLPWGRHPALLALTELRSFSVFYRCSEAQYEAVKETDLGETTPPAAPAATSYETIVLSSTRCRIWEKGKKTLQPAPAAANSWALQPLTAGSTQSSSSS